MTDSLSSLQAAGDGAVTALVTRLRAICAEFEAVENDDSTEYKDGLLRELAGLAEALRKMGVEPSDIFADDTESVPYEIVTIMF